MLFRETARTQLRGEFETAFQNADKKIDFTYETPIEHHQPLEPHSTIAVWEGGNLTVYNGSQIVGAVHGSLAGTFGLKPENVRVITPHIGGGFGSKGGAWGNVIIAAMAARVVNRPVELALTRQNMFNSVGLRQRNRQHLRIAAAKDGKLTAARARDADPYRYDRGVRRAVRLLIELHVRYAALADHVPRRADECDRPDVYAGTGRIYRQLCA